VSTESAAEGRPVVVIAGRPNVGKSTLVNRIVGRRVAIVEEKPGVTRDRLFLDAEWAGREFVIADTGGILERGDALDAKVTSQATRAVREADLVLFVADASVGVTAEDEAVANTLRRLARDVLLVANKVDSSRREADAWELAGLGLGEPMMVSALHGRGVGDLLDRVISLLPPPEAEVEAEAADGQTPPMGEDQPAEDAAIVSVAIVGRPNVGKSTLFNNIIGDERSVVHDVAGTTRDAIDTIIETDDGPLRVVDTAGMRRKSRIGEGSEYYSFVRSIAAIDRSDIALLVIDATEGVTHQDQRLAERVDAAGSPIIVVLNKWDLVGTAARLEIAAAVTDKLSFLEYAPILRISAKTGLGVHRLLPSVRAAIDAYHRRIPTSQLNSAISAAQSRHPAKGARILYAVQGAVDPPTVTLFATNRLHPTYLRYIERSLRERFELGPSPLQLRVRVRRSR
jgi:GTP-binding protein